MTDPAPLPWSAVPGCGRPDCCANVLDANGDWVGALSRADAELVVASVNAST